MKTTIMLSALILIARLGAADMPAPAVQIASAILAAPEELRDGAAVLGYNGQGELVSLREGRNELICLANNPDGTSFSVACYHKDLEPYMARGRELLAQKVTGKARNDIRWKEVADGKLALPREPRTLARQTRALLPPLCHLQCTSSGRRRQHGQSANMGMPGAQ